MSHYITRSPVHISILLPSTSIRITFVQSPEKYFEFPAVNEMLLYEFPLFLITATFYIKEQTTRRVLA